MQSKIFNTIQGTRHNDKSKANWFFRGESSQERNNSYQRQTRTAAIGGYNTMARNDRDSNQHSNVASKSGVRPRAPLSGALRSSGSDVSEKHHVSTSRGF